MAQGIAVTGTRRAMTIVGASLAAAVAVLCTATSSARASGWLAPVNVSTPQAAQSIANCFLGAQAGIGGVNVAVNAGGEMIAAWTQADGATQDVKVAIRPPGGSFGPAKTIGTTAPCYFLGILGASPKTAIDAQGNAVVVWPHPLASTTVIQAAVRPAGGAFGSPVDLSDGSRTANSDPYVAMSANGTAVAVWTWNNGTHTVIQAAVRPRGGSFPAAGTAATLSDTAQNASSAIVAMNDRGDAAVVWSRSNGTNDIAQARVRPAGGAFAPAVDLSLAGADAETPDVAVDPVGRATAVWTRSNLVESRFLTAAGALDGGIDNVSDTAETVSVPTIALDANNNAVAVWTGGNLTKAASRPSRGSFGSPQTISSPGDSNALPTAAMDPAGNAIAIWTQSIAKIQAARRPPNGTFGGVEDVSRPPGAGVIASLDIDGQGNAVVGWTYLQTDNKEVAQVTAFDAAAPTLGAVSVPATGTVGKAVPMSATATDRWSGAKLSWAFGDGATGSGGAPAHTYGAPGVYTVTVKATDAAGNAASGQRTIQVSNPPPPPPPPVVLPSAPTPKATPVLTFTLAFKYSASKRSTRLTSLLAQHVPTGSTITATCAPPKHKGKSVRCPAKSFRKTKAHGTVKLKSFLHKAFKRGTVIEVRVTRAGAIGAVKRLTIRSTNGPSSTSLCLRPGATKPARRC